jgi:hypothetical protein
VIDASWLSAMTSINRCLANQIKSAVSGTSTIYAWLRCGEHQTGPKVMNFHHRKPLINFEGNQDNIEKNYKIIKDVIHR